MPAEFAGAADLVRSAEGAGDDLAAEADAEHGAVLPLEVAQQFEKLRKIGIVLVGQRVLAAAEHDRGVMRVGVGGQRLAVMGAAKIDLGAGLRQCCADLAEAGIVVVLDDEHPQRQSPDNPACAIDAARLSWRPFN